MYGYCRGKEESVSDENIFGAVIFNYTRADALRDGVIVDISKLPATIEAGIRIPVAVTRAVFNVLNPNDELKRHGQSMEGRVWDMFTIFRLELRRKGGNTDRIHFAPLFLMDGRLDPVPVKMWALCGPGDNAEPTITIMLEGED